MVLEVFSTLSDSMILRLILMSEFPLSSVSIMFRLLYFDAQIQSYEISKNRITSALPRVCISKAAPSYLKLSFQVEEKQLAQ